MQSIEDETSLTTYKPVESPLSIHPLHDALYTVRTLRRSLVGKQRFKGWSGPTRILSGCLALAAALALHFGWLPSTNLMHVAVWGGVFLAAMLLNLGALVHWFWNDRAVDRDPQRLKPILDVMPPLAVGALFTLALLLRREFDLLFGVWMCMFGLSNLASRYVLPSTIALVGVFYIAAGALCLLLPGMEFRQPLAMGTVFCAGELAGGLILYLDDRRYAAVLRHLGPFDRESLDPDPSDSETRP